MGSCDVVGTGAGGGGGDGGKCSGGTLAPRYPFPSMAPGEVKLGTGGGGGRSMLSLAEVLLLLLLAKRLFRAAVSWWCIGEEWAAGGMEAEAPFTRLRLCNSFDGGGGGGGRLSLLTSRVGDVWVPPGGGAGGGWLGRLVGEPGNW